MGYYSLAEALNALINITVEAMGLNQVNFMNSTRLLRLIVTTFNVHLMTYVKLGYDTLRTFLFLFVFRWPPLA